MGMKTKTTTIPEKLLQELQQVIDNAKKGVRDPDVMKKACKEMDRLREELRKERSPLTPEEREIFRKSSRDKISVEETKKKIAQSNKKRAPNLDL